MSSGDARRGRAFPSSRDPDFRLRTLVAKAKTVPQALWLTLQQLFHSPSNAQGTPEASAAAGLQALHAGTASAAQLHGLVCWLRRRPEDSGAAFTAADVDREFEKQFVKYTHTAAAAARERQQQTPRRRPSHHAASFQPSQPLTAAEADQLREVLLQRAAQAADSSCWLSLVAAVAPLQPAPGASTTACSNGDGGEQAAAAAEQQQVVQRVVAALTAFAAGGQQQQQQQQQQLEQQCRAAHCVLACLSSAAAGLQAHIPHDRLVAAVKRGLEWCRQPPAGTTQGFAPLWHLFGIQGRDGGAAESKLQALLEHWQFSIPPCSLDFHAGGSSTSTSSRGHHTYHQQQQHHDQQHRHRRRSPRPYRHQHPQHSVAAGGGQNGFATPAEADAELAQQVRALREEAEEARQRANELQARLEEVQASLRSAQAAEAAAAGAAAEARARQHQTTAELSAVAEGWRARAAAAEAALAAAGARAAAVDGQSGRVDAPSHWYSNPLALASVQEEEQQEQEEGPQEQQQEQQQPSTCSQCKQQQLWGGARMAAMLAASLALAACAAQIQLLQPASLRRRKAAPLAVAAAHHQRPPQKAFSRRC